MEEWNCFIITDFHVIVIVQIDLVIYLVVCHKAVQKCDQDSPSKHIYESSEITELTFLVILRLLEIICNIATFLS